MAKAKATFNDQTGLAKSKTAEATIPTIDMGNAISVGHVCFMVKVSLEKLEEYPTGRLGREFSSTFLAVPFCIGKDTSSTQPAVDSTRIGANVFVE